MFKMPDYTRPDSAYPSRCRLQRLFSSRSISMYESTHTPERDELLPRLKSSQSFNPYKCLSSPVSNFSKLGNLKARLSGAGPSFDTTLNVTCREREPESKTCASALRSSAALPASYRMSESYFGRRPLSPSFLDLTPSPGNQPPEYDSPSEYPSGYPSLSKYQSTSAYHSPPAICISATPCTKRIKRKPPPLILRDSFHATDSQSSTLAVPPIDVNAPLTPLTPLTPLSPRYRMPSEKEQLRRRLLKLQRTLGEQITPGLIIRPKPNPEVPESTALAGPPDDHNEKTTFIQHCHRTSTSLNPTSDFFPTRSTLYAPTDQDLFDLDSRFSTNLPVPLTHNRKSTAQVPSSPSLHSPKYFLLPETVALTPMTLTAFAGSVTPRSDTPTGRSFEFVLDCDVQDSSSEDDEYECPPLFSFDGDSYPPSPLQSEYAYLSDDGLGDTVLVDLPYLAPARNELSSILPGTPGVRRKERRNGWSGEWNQAHIQDVIEKLRTL